MHGMGAASPPGGLVDSRKRPRYRCRAVKLKVNGSAREVPEGTTLAGLLALMKLETETVAAEVNAQVVRRARHAEYVLSAGDQVELVTFVGGG
jgi:sulfur carrier protein